MSKYEKEFKEEAIRLCKAKGSNKAEIKKLKKENANQFTVSTMCKVFFLSRSQKTVMMSNACCA
jgi:hypothetical protein